MRFLHQPKSTLTLAALCLFAQTAWGHIGVPRIFTSNMVLQQKQPNRVWGWGDAGDTITVSIAKQVPLQTTSEFIVWML